MSLLLLFGGGGSTNSLTWTEADDVWSITGAQRIVRLAVDRRELLWTHDLDGFQSGAIGHDMLELWHDERLDQSEQLGLEIPTDHTKAYLLAPDLDLVTRGRRFHITELEAARTGTESTLRVEADAAWYRLGDIVHAGSLVLTAATPNEGLQLILRLTGWTAGPSTTLSTDEYSMEQQDLTVLQLLRKWAKITGRVLVFNTMERSVDLADTRGADLGLAFRYGRNLRGARRRTKPPELTVLYPYGADDLTIAGINGGLEYLEDFTYYTDQGIDLDDVGPDGLTNRERYTRSRVWSDSSFLVDTDLLAAAEARLALLAQPIVSYELDVIDLSEVSGNIEQVRPGDRCQVYDPDFPADVAATVTRFLRYRQEPWRNKIELSTILNPIVDSGEAGSRPARSEDWHQFVGPVRSAYVIRNDGDYITNRIPLAFRNGGRANFHLDLNAVGVGNGVMHVEIVDTAADPEAQQFYAVDVPYLDGEPVRALVHWATEDLEDSYDFRVRATTIADGGPSPTNGIDIAADADSEASFWIMAQGAIQETPTSPNSLRFDYTGAVQYFTVPDGVTLVEIEANGGAGGHDFDGPGGGSRGLKLTAQFSVIPGGVLDVYVGGQGALGASLAWPNGGPGDNLPTGDSGAGAASSDVRASGAAFVDAWIVAAGAGGDGGKILGTPDNSGGAGGFLTGGDGLHTGFGSGATQFAGGLHGGTVFVGTDGTFNQGGAAGNCTNSFSRGGGGGGGGWYGGGGGGNDSGGAGDRGGGGGGGSGRVNGDGFDISAEDGGGPAGHGYVEFRWETPD